MTAESLLPMWIILLLVPSSFCLLTITKLTTDTFEGSAPRLHIEWSDTRATRSYVITINRTSTKLPAPPSSPWQNETDIFNILFENLEIAAKYSVRVQTKDGFSFNGGLIETPNSVTPFVNRNGDVFVLTVSNSLANQTVLLAYKLKSYNEDKSRYPDARSSSGDVIKLFYRINPAVPQKILIGNGEKTGPNNEYNNIRLDTGSQYAFTQCFTIVNDGTHCYEWSNPSTVSSSASSDEVVGIVVGVVAAIVGIVFIVICIFNWKYGLRYRPKPTKPTPIDRLVTDSAIPVCEDDFFDHVCQMKLHNFKGFYEEFSCIKKKSEYQNAEEFGEPENQHKNRFLNIPCYDETRVKLEGGSNIESYIHANYVTGALNKNEYIYAQSPLPETVVDFWKMVWQQKSDVIVMIGQLIEKERQECAAYFPDVHNTTMHTYCEVTLTHRHDTTTYIVRSLLLSKSGEIRKVTHYQYHGWPTNKMTPEYPSSFLRMILRISKSITQRPGRPIVVHGTNDRHGRGGIYICIDSQVQRFHLTEDLSVFGCVVACIKQRHDGVKTLDEYIFIHDAICEAVLLNDIESITVDTLPKHIEDASKTNNGKDDFDVEFEMLTSAAMSSTQKMAAAGQTCNESKNRYSKVKPYDYNRVKLKKIKGKEGSDYINASYIDTYKRKRPFIAAQAPLVETIADFWRMIYENKSWVIVMLGQEIEGGQLKANRFWPDEGNAMKLGDITIKSLSITRNEIISDVWIRKIELVDENGECQQIQFYQYQEWPAQKVINSQNIRSLIQLINDSENWKQKLKAQFITVVSSSGVGRPGVIIALTSLQEEADSEGSVDVFRAVQQLNQQRLPLVETKDEYKLIYTATLEITENARRRPVIKELSADDDDVGTTLGINLDISPITERKISIEKDSPISERKISIEKDTSKSEKPAKKGGVSFAMPAEDETDKHDKRPVGRVNTKSYESKM